MSTPLPPAKPPAEVHPMQALLDQGGYDMPQRGDIREGTIISVSPHEIIVDLGLKREAIVPASDLSRLDEEVSAELQEGATCQVYILQTSDREGNLIVSVSRALQEKDWLVAQDTMDRNEMLECEVSGANSGGLEVVFGKLRGFVPASHLSTVLREMSADDRKAHLATYVGQKIPVKVVEVDRKRRRLILSERAARRRWQREHRKQLLDEIEVGEVRTGTVRSLSEFGAFVDLGGADGLVHISELAWHPVAHPQEVLKVGQQVEVRVLRVDKQRERVGLSLKRAQPDPWDDAVDLYHAGELVESIVTRVTDFGAFVRLPSGIEGLLHVSEMADIRPEYPQSLVKPGDLLLLRVLRVESDRRRIGLSLRQVSEAEWAEWAARYREEHPAGDAEAAAGEPVEASVEGMAAGEDMPGAAAAEDEAPIGAEAIGDVEAVAGEMARSGLSAEAETEPADAVAAEDAGAEAAVSAASAELDIAAVVTEVEAAGEAAVQEAEVVASAEAEAAVELAEVEAAGAGAAVQEAEAVASAEAEAAVELAEVEAAGEAAAQEAEAAASAEAEAAVELAEVEAAGEAAVQEAEEVSAAAESEMAASFAPEMGEPVADEEGAILEHGAGGSAA